MKTLKALIVMIALSSTLYAQESSALSDSTTEAYNLFDLEAEKTIAERDLQILSWRNEDLLKVISKIESRNQNLMQNRNSATQIHINQNLEEIAFYQAMMNENNLEMERLWSLSQSLEEKIQTLDNQLALQK